MQFTISVLTTLALVAGSRAHMRMANPQQWGFNDATGASPLSGLSDFPCGNYHNLDPEGIKAYGAHWTKGGTGTLQVVGGATHGGGSGQMVITYDFPPKPESVWKVMQSWEGDHPVKADGNMSDNPDGGHPEIPFAIPAGLPEGRAVVAWSWFNRIGNREWYMKCATVEILNDKTLSAERIKEESFESLPEMFRANVPEIAGSCSIPEGVNAIDFGESAGKNVVVAPGAEPQYFEGCGKPSGTTPTQPETSSQPEAPAPSSTYVEQPAGPTSAPEGDDNSESGSGDSEELPTQPAEPIASPSAAPAAPSAAPSPIAQPDNSNKETDTGSSGSCVEGTTVCTDGNTWSQCGSGRMQNMGLVPAGLTCNGGKLIAKRALRFSAEHRRHRSRHV